MIFLDMDGVLCDFITEAFVANGKKFDATTYPKGKFACEEVIGCSTEEFWARIDECGEFFWESLQPYPWCLELVRCLESFDKVVISTSPSRSPHCYSGKRRWLMNMGLHRLDSMFGSSKWLMARPGRLLVDDGEHNIVKWEQQGGDFIVIPQPWNFATPTDDVVGMVNLVLQKKKAG